MPPSMPELSERLLAGMHSAWRNSRMLEHGANGTQQAGQVRSKFKHHPRGRRKPKPSQRAAVKRLQGVRLMPNMAWVQACPNTRPMLFKTSLICSSTKPVSGTPSFGSSSSNPVWDANLVLVDLEQNAEPSKASSTEPRSKENIVRVAAFVIAAQHKDRTLK